MKKITIVCSLVFLTATLSAQGILERIDESNTWFKLGPNVALPLGDLGNITTFAAGVDLSVQFLETRSSGIGLKAGYLNYFGDGNLEDVGIIPLAVLYRYYPKSSGLFAGLEAGYALISNVPTIDGGAFFRPQLGIHTDHWNFFAYYDYIALEAVGISDLSSVGLAATYNIRFDK
jgi:hypothetical protein